MPYLWERAIWPDLRWDKERLSRLLATVSHEQGRLQGKMEALGFDLRNEAHLRTLTEDVVKSSEIEGELLDPDQVRSSIARRLGLNIAGLVPADRDVEGVVEMMLDATGKFDEPLTEERLHGWHAALFPTGRSGMVRIIAGAWRDDRNGPMQVVSGPMGREQVHYEAPPAARVADEMARFLAWFADPGDEHPLFVAALAHLWFVTIHPFDDGNGRIARAIADMALARSEMIRQRFYSMSSQIMAERKDYYHVLEWTQKGDMDVTRWQEWFLGCLHRAIGGSAVTLDAVMIKARFWDRFAKEPLNSRQIKIMNKLLDGFEGKLTSSKWARIAKCSQDTASRDIKDLIERGALKKNPGGGRSTSYSIESSSFHELSSSPESPAHGLHASMRQGSSGWG
ncbi:MAG: Fic family protein [Gammaproteobacteria bacterium]|nr:Fic family protein [Gammaproteobacteria bacterium]MYG65598.1 Fic family protein [Gammaproteobacteria bacterium]